MTTQLTCAACGKDMGVLRDAKIRIGMVVYCRGCDENNRKKLQAVNYFREQQKHDMPDFLRGIFR